MVKQFSLILFIYIVLVSCIGDDIINDEVDPLVQITSNVSEIALGENFQFEANFLNNIGVVETVSKTWTSTNENIITIDDMGLATAVAVGTADILVTVQNESMTITDIATIKVGEETVQALTSRSGVIRTTSSYELTGNFTLENQGEDGLVLSIDDTYKTTSALPGLYIYLTNNPNSRSGALELGEVTVFEGAHSYNIPSGVNIMDHSYVLYFCKPFNVKVGDGEFL